MSVLSLVNKKYISGGMSDGFDEYASVINLEKRIKSVFAEPKQVRLLSVTEIKSRVAQYLVELMVDVMEIDFATDEEELYGMLCDNFSLEELFYLRRGLLECSHDEETITFLDKEDEAIFEQLKMAFLV